MNTVIFKTPQGRQVRVEGSAPYYRMVCDFHATDVRPFVERLEREVFIRSIVFRQGETVISFSRNAVNVVEPVADIVRKTVEETLP